MKLPQRHRGPGRPAQDVSLLVRRRWLDGRWEDEEALLGGDEGIRFRMPLAEGDEAAARRLVELGLPGRVRGRVPAAARVTPAARALVMPSTKRVISRQ
jgi:hypothetical protein